MTHQKLALIVHRWGGTPKSDWYPWARAQLRTRGYDVLVPSMPNTDEPDITAWTHELQTMLEGNPAQSLLLIGHSSGCQTILRTLEKTQSEVDRAIFIAGWVQLTGLTETEAKVVKPWLTQPIEALTVAHCLKESIALFSSDDPYVPLMPNQAFFQQKIGAKPVILSGYGHFDEDTNVSKIPELLGCV